MGLKDEEECSLENDLGDETVLQFGRRNDSEIVVLFESRKKMSLHFFFCSKRVENQNSENHQTFLSGFL